MGQQVIETRRYKLAEVVVFPKDIRDLATIVHETSKQRAERALIRFSVHAKDGSEFESATSDIFAQGGILDSKQIDSLEMTYFEYETEARIRIRITHTDSSFAGNEIIVSGADSTWVNGVMARLQDAVSGWKPQPAWVRKYQWVLNLVFAFSIGRLYLLALDIVFEVLRIQPVSPRPAWAEALLPFRPLIMNGIGFMVGIWPALWMTEKVRALWPVVEICAGRDYAQEARTRRLRLAAFLSLGVLPILISIVYDLVKLLGSI